MVLTQEAPNKLRAGAVVPDEGFAGTRGSKFTHKLVCRRPLCLSCGLRLAAGFPQSKRSQKVRQSSEDGSHCVLGRLISEVGVQPPPSPRPPTPVRCGRGLHPWDGGEGARSEADHRRPPSADVSKRGQLGMQGVAENDGTPRLLPPHVAQL